MFDPVSMPQLNGTMRKEIPDSREFGKLFSWQSARFNKLKTLFVAQFIHENLLRRSSIYI